MGSTGEERGGGPAECRAPGGEPLIGRWVGLEPITAPVPPQDVEGLHELMRDPGAFGSGHPFMRPHADRAETAAFLDGRAALDGTAYLVRAVGARLAEPGTVLGTSSLMDVDVPNEKLHLGTTFYGRRHWGGPTNAEAKLLVLGHAFDDCGFGRVRIQCDARNERSRAAIHRLGARLEGVHRRDVRRVDGSWRDTVVFSILRDEWPDCRAALRDRLRRFEETAEQTEKRQDA